MEMELHYIHYIRRHLVYANAWLWSRPCCTYWL